MIFFNLRFIILYKLLCLLNKSMEGWVLIMKNKRIMSLLLLCNLFMANGSMLGKNKNLENSSNSNQSMASRVLTTKSKKKVRDLRNRKLRKDKGDNTVKYVGAGVVTLAALGALAYSKCSRYGSKVVEDKFTECMTNERNISSKEYDSQDLGAIIQDAVKEVNDFCLKNAFECNPEKMHEFYIKFLSNKGYKLVSEPGKGDKWQEKMSGRYSKGDISFDVLRPGAGSSDSENPKSVSGFDVRFNGCSVLGLRCCEYGGEAGKGKGLTLNFIMSNGTSAKYKKGVDENGAHIFQMLDGHDEKTKKPVWLDMVSSQSN